MMHIKKIEEIGEQLGYHSLDLQYAAVVGCLGGKVEVIANILERLWSTPGLEFSDLHRALMNIDQTIKDVVEED